MSEESPLQGVELLWWIYVMPVLATFGMITNSLSIVVIAQIRVKDTTYFLMLVTSCADLIYLTLQLFNSFATGGPYSSFSDFYLMQAIRHATYYLTSALALFNVIIELVICVRRYMILVNRKNRFLNLPNSIVVLLATVIALLVYLPKFFVYRVVEKESGSSRFAMIVSEFGRSGLGRFLLISITVLRAHVTLLLMLVINLVTMFKFNSLVNRKRKMQSAQPDADSIVSVQTHSRQRRERRVNASMTRMILCMNFLYIICNLPYSITFILDNALPPSSYLTCLNFVALAFLFAYHSVFFFIYLNYNRHFRRSYESTISTLFSRSC
nr:G protein-coupled receptor [Proales similis]